MKIRICTDRSVLNPCPLEKFNFQVDPYVGCSHYCSYCYGLSRAETDWSAEIQYHKDLPERLKGHLSTIRPQTIYLGWETDPYQPCEVIYRQTRQVLEVLLEMGFSASILTKSDLFIRDLDLLKAMEGSAVSISLAFNESFTRQLFEADTVDNTKRVAALIRAKEAGIRTSAMICPVIPFMTNPIPLVEMVGPHTNLIWVYGLSAKNHSDRGWRNVRNILSRHFPGLEEKVEDVIFSNEHTYWIRIREKLIKAGETRDLNLKVRL
ncbi:MAG: hypothetical protein MI862_04185 [Desulfobacterales bacterium]|nr:hypothetical protein [Desulfobacterales bacterium]